MSTTIELRFPAGRFHATPWGRHVNEAATEWPPSPWRILRALIWVWKNKAPDLLTTTEAEELFRVLSESSPSFHLPRATHAHTRHYMPWSKNWATMKENAKAMIFDAFMVINREDPVSMTWPFDLTEFHKEKLSQLLNLLGHLGRAESWCIANLSEKAPEINCFPAEEGEDSDRSEIVPILCADGEEAFSDEHIPRPKPAKGKAKSQPKLPCDPPWHLCMETGQLQKDGWSDPPGSKWVRYRRNPDLFLPKAAPRITPGVVHAKLARYLIDSVVRPLVQDSLAIAETARRYLMGIYRRLEEEKLGLEHGSSKPGEFSSPTFSGKSSDGTPLKGHKHAFFLPLDRDGDGRIDQLVVYSEAGFSQTETRALRLLNRIPLGDDHPVRLALLGLEEKGIWPVSNVWISTTPYLSTRFPKKNGTKKDPAEFFAPGGDVLLLKADLLQQICNAGLPEPKAIDPLLDSNGVFRSPASQGRLGLRPIQFLTQRRKEPRNVRRPAGFFRIVWDQPVKGPVQLGHNSHFGLGMFQPGG